MSVVCSRAPLSELMEGRLQQTVILNSRTGQKHAEIEVRLLNDTGTDDDTESQVCDVFGLGSVRAQRDVTDEMSIIDSLTSNWARDCYEVKEVKTELLHLKHVVEQRCLRAIENVIVSVDCKLLLPKTQHSSTQTEDTENMPPKIKTEFEDVPIERHNTNVSVSGGGFKIGTELKIEAIDSIEELLVEDCTLSLENKADTEPDECKISLAAEVSRKTQLLNNYVDGDEGETSSNDSSMEKTWKESLEDPSATQELRETIDNTLVIDEVKSEMIEMVVSEENNHIKNEDKNSLLVSTTEVSRNRPLSEEVSPVISHSLNNFETPHEYSQEETKPRQTLPLSRLDCAEESVESSSSSVYQAAEGLDCIHDPKEASKTDNVDKTKLGRLESYDGLKKVKCRILHANSNANEINISCSETSEHLETSLDDDFVEILPPSGDTAVLTNASAKGAISPSKVGELSKGFFVAKEHVWSLNPNKIMQAAFECFRQGLLTSFTVKIERYVNRLRDETNCAQPSCLFEIHMHPGTHQYCVNLSSFTGSLFKIPILESSCDLMLNMQHVRSGQRFFPEVYIAENLTTRPKITVLPLKSYPAGDEHRVGPVEETEVSSSPSIVANSGLSHCSIPKIISVSSVRSSEKRQTSSLLTVNNAETDVCHIRESQSSEPVDYSSCTKTRKRTQVMTSRNSPCSKSVRSAIISKCNSNALKIRSVRYQMEKDRIEITVGDPGSENKDSYKCAKNRSVDHTHSPAVEYTPEDLNKTNAFALTSLLSEYESRYSVSIGQHVKMGCRNCEKKSLRGFAFRCRLCTDHFISKKSLWQHLNSSHRRFVCTSCGQRSLNEAQYNHHQGSCKKTR